MVGQMKWWRRRRGRTTCCGTSPSLLTCSMVNSSPVFTASNAVTLVSSLIHSLSCRFLCQWTHAFTSKSRVGFSLSSSFSLSLDLLCIVFIHSGNFYNASSSPLLLRSVPDTAQILCQSFMPKHHRQL